MDPKSEDGFHQEVKHLSFVNMQDVREELAEICQEHEVESSAMNFPVVVPRYSPKPRWIQVP